MREKLNAELLAERIITMTEEELREHRKRLQEIALEAKTRLKAIDDERDERKS